MPLTDAAAAGGGADLLLPPLPGGFAGAPEGALNTCRCARDHRVICARNDRMLHQSWAALACGPGDVTVCTDSFKAKENPKP